ncbi:MAG: DUF1800 family protein [Acidimicrobiales bacterium]
MAETVIWWTNQMARPDAGIHERMTWFWHGVLTSSGSAANSEHMVGDQLQPPDQRAGNFRELLHGFVTDGLLLLFLIADGSQASNPNENLARELLELFTMGPGDASKPNYTQDDVRSTPARGCGWLSKTQKTRTVLSSGSNGPTRDAPLIFMTKAPIGIATAIVDRVCDHPATARRIAFDSRTDLLASPRPTTAHSSSAPGGSRKTSTSSHSLAGSCPAQNFDKHD